MEMNCECEIVNNTIKISCSCEQVFGRGKCCYFNKRGRRKTLKLIRKNMNGKKRKKVNGNLR